MPHPSYLVIHTCTICTLHVCLRAIDHDDDQSTVGMYVRVPLGAFTRHSHVAACKLTGCECVSSKILASQPSRHHVAKCLVYETGV